MKQAHGSRQVYCQKISRFKIGSSQDSTLMLKVAVGHSNDPDSEVAVLEVIEQCLAQLSEDTPPIAGLLLAAIDFEHQLILDRICDQFPNIALIGGTTDGEISSQLQFHQDSLVLTLFCSNDVQIQAGVGRHLSQDTLAGTLQSVTEAKGTNVQIPKLCLTIAEGMGYDCNAVVESLHQALGETFPVFGGATADQQRFDKSYQFFGREVLTDAVTVLLVYGDVKFSCGVAHGWQPIGKSAHLTKVGPNKVLEIDGDRALDLYDYYLKGLKPSPEYPLAIFEEDGEQFYLRSPIGSDRETGEIEFLTNLPVNSKVQVASTSRDDVLVATQDSFKTALDRYPGPQDPEFALIFSCCTRRQILGTRTEEECQLINQLAPTNLSFMGFYTYGEIGPSETDGPVRLHHETFITLLLG
jgi:hypothetical protein